MASPSTSAPDHRASTGNSQKSHFQQTVCLADWWLVKAENDAQGRRLAVAGLTDWGKHAMRVFTSAPILIRYDTFTLGTSDGICVVLNGFINKARTLENGFPSNVFNYFVFGFPPYWKEYDEKFVGKEPLSEDILRDKLLEQLPQQLGSMEAAQPHVDSHEKDFGSQGKIEAKDRRKSKRAKSLAVALPSGGSSVQDHTAPELPVNCVENEVESLSNLTCNGSIKIPAIIDKNTDYFRISGSGGTLSACQLYNKRTNREADNLRKMDDEKAKTNSDWDMSSSENILNHSEVRVITRSIRNVKMKKVNNQRSAGIADCEKIRLNSISSIGSGKVELQLVVVDREPGSRDDWSSEVSGLHITTDKIEFSLSDAASIQHGFDQIPETCNQDKCIREIKTRSKTQKAKNKATELPCTLAAPTKSHHSPVVVDNKTDTIITGKDSLSEKAKAMNKVTRQKSTPAREETPDRKNSKKEKGWSASPQTRSRSGRLLMPTLEFWRNQRAIYDADRTIIGIEEGMHP